MTANLMTYALILATWCLLAGMAGDHIAGLLRVPRRGVWVVAGLVSVLGLAAVPVRHRQDPVAVVPVRVNIAPSAEQIAAHDKAVRALSLETPETERELFQPVRLAVRRLQMIPVNVEYTLGVFWVMGSLLLAGLQVLGFVVLYVRRRRWASDRWQERDVLVAVDDGPAVVGAIHPQIVVPQWASELDAESQRLILTHEAEHLRARDPLVMRLASVIMVLMPWNLPLWGIVRRLRLALELDCDQRVLAGQDKSTAYAELLLLVASRRSRTTSMLALAFLAPKSSLRRRIVAMTSTPRRFRKWQAGIGTGALAALLWMIVTTPAPRLAAQQNKVNGGIELTSVAPMRASLERLRGHLAPVPMTDEGQVLSLLRRYHPELVKEPLDHPLDVALKYLHGVAFIRNGSGAVIDTISIGRMAEVGLAMDAVLPGPADDSGHDAIRHAIERHVLAKLREQGAAELVTARTSRLQLAQAWLLKSEHTAPPNPLLPNTQERSHALAVRDVQYATSQLEMAKTRETSAAAQLKLANQIWDNANLTWSDGVPVTAATIMARQDFRRMVTAYQQTAMADATALLNTLRIDAGVGYATKVEASDDVVPPGGRAAAPTPQMMASRVLADRMPPDPAALALARDALAIDVVRYPAGALWQRELAVYYVTLKR